MLRIIKRILIAVPFVVIPLMVPRALAEDGTLPFDVTSLDQWLTYLVGGGAAVLTTMLLSFLAEKWPGWAAINSGVKFIASVVISGGLGLAAWAVITYTPPEALIALKAPFAAVMLSVAPIIFGQLFHNSNKTAQAVKQATSELQG